MIFIIVAAVVFLGASLFAAYHIGYSDGADGNYRLMMQQWKQIEIEREKLDQLRLTYSSNCTK